MEKSINLLPTQSRGAIVEKRRARLLLIVSVVVLSVAAVTGVGLWSAQLLVGRQIATAESNIARLQQDISSRSQVEQRQQLLTNRLKEANVILNSRPDLANRLLTLMQLFPADALLNDITFSGKGEQIDLALSVNTYDSFVKVYQIFDQASFKSVAVKSFGRAEDGMYSFTLNLIQNI